MTLAAQAMAVGVLEGDRDPRCGATAGRLEDLMRGTTFATYARSIERDRHCLPIVSL